MVGAIRADRRRARQVDAARRGGSVSKDLRDRGLASISIEDILKPGFSTPWDAPTIPPLPFSFRRILTLVWRTTEAAVKRVLPPPLEPIIVFAHIYRMPDTDWLGPYGEANVSGDSLAFDATFRL